MTLPLSPDPSEWVLVSQRDGSGVKLAGAGSVKQRGWPLDHGQVTSTLFGVFRLDQATSDLALAGDRGKPTEPQAPSHKLDTIGEYKKL